MLRKMAICTVLLLLLVPAFAMAAGQGPGFGGAEGNGGKSALQNCNQETIMNLLQAGGEDQRYQTRICSQEGQRTMALFRTQNQTMGACGEKDQFRTMEKNMTRDRIQDRIPLQDGLCGNCPGGITLSSASTDRQQDQFRTMAGNMTRDRIQDRIPLRDGSCGNCPNR